MHLGTVSSPRVSLYVRLRFDYDFTAHQAFVFMKMCWIFSSSGITVHAKFQTKISKFLYPPATPPQKNTHPVSVFSFFAILCPPAGSVCPHLGPTKMEYLYQTFSSVCYPVLLQHAAPPMPPVSPTENNINNNNKQEHASESVSLPRPAL